MAVPAYLLGFSASTLGASPTTADLAQPLWSWSFNESGGSAVQDQGTLGMTGQVRGRVQRVPGLDGSAIRLDGASWVVSEARVGEHLRDAFTVEAWIRPAQLKSGQYSTLASQAAATGDPGWVVYHTGWNDLFGFYCWGASGRSRVDIFPGFVMGGWRHYVATYDNVSGQAAVYVDGVRIRAGSTAGPLGGAAGSFIVGSYRPDRVEMGFVGDIDELRVYGQALTDEQIIARYLERSPLEAQDAVVTQDYPAPLRAEGPTPPLFVGDNWVREARVVTHRFQRNTTPERADAVARSVRDQGGNALVAEGFRYLLGREGDPDNWWKSMPKEDYLRTMRIIREACDRYGLKLIGRITANVGLPGYAKEHPEHVAYDFRTGEHAWDRGYAFHLDMNNPAYVESYLNTLGEHMESVRYDGMHVDETTFRSLSIPDSTYNRKIFESEYGERIAALDARGVYDNMHNEAWRKWIAFRIRTEDHFREMIMSRVRRHIEGEPFLSGTNNDIRPASPRLAGADLERQSAHQTMNMYECEPLNPLSWRNAYSEAKVYTSLNPSTFHSYAASVSQQYLSWAFTKVCNMSTHLWPEFNGGASIPLNWEAKWSPVLNYQDTWANVAVVYSMSTVAMSPRYERFYDSFLGWVQALTDAHVPVQAVSVRRMNVEALSRYAVVVLPDVSCMSEEQADVIRQYVAGGGRVIATGETGQYDELGNRRQQNLLQDVLGVEIASGDRDGTAVRLQSAGGSGGPRTLEVHAPMQHVATITAGTSGVMARTDEGEPAIVQTRYRNGRVCYMAFRPGTRYFMPKVGLGWYGHGGYWYDDRDPAFRELMVGWVRSYAGRLDVETANMPQELIVNPQRHQFNEYRGISIQMLNMLGARFEEHAIAPRFADYEYLDYPSPNTLLNEGEVMSLVVATDRAKAAYLVSPDYHAAVRLPLDPLGEGRVRVTLPDFPRYGFVYIVESDADIVADTAAQVTDTQPAIEPFVANTFVFAEDFNQFSELAVRIPFPNWVGTGNATMLVRSDLDRGRKGVRVLEISSTGGGDETRFGQVTTARPLSRSAEPGVYSGSAWFYCYARPPHAAPDTPVASTVTVTLLNDKDQIVCSSALSHQPGAPGAFAVNGVRHADVTLPDDAWINFRFDVDERNGAIELLAEDEEGNTLAQWSGRGHGEGAGTVDRLRIRSEASETGSAFHTIFDDITVRRSN